MEIVKPLKEIKSLSRAYTLINENNPKIKLRNLYKYMDLETALICLKNKSIRFVQPTEWPDKYESHFYNADYSNITQDQSVTPRIWACCFTHSRMSEASWNTYKYGKKGLGCRCVKFQISRSKFRKMILKDKRVQNSIEGLMDYSLSDYDILHIHQRNSSLYHSVFKDGFSKEHYLSLLLLKRNAFYYESEFRFMITSNKIKDTETKIYIDIEWGNLIDKVEIDNEATDMEVEILKKFLEEAKVKKDVINNLNRSKLYEDPIGPVKIES